MIGSAGRGPGDVGKPGARRSGAGILIAAVWLLVLSAAARAEEAIPKKVDFSAAVRYSFPTGHEEGGVNWSDLYDPGFGGALELSYRLRPRLAFHVGGAYDTYPAREVLFSTSVGPVTGRFNDQKLMTLYLGARGYLLGTDLPQKSAGIDPYLRADLGVTQFNGAGFNGSPDGSRSRAFAFAIGIGADFLTASNFIFFLEGRYEDHGTPDRAGASFRAFPILAGVRYLL